VALAVTLTGLLLAAGGVGGGAAYVLLALCASEETFPLTGVTGVAGLMTLGLVLGGLLIWQGVRTWRGEPDTLFRFPHPVGLAILFLVAVIIGQGVLSFDLVPRLLFPPFQVLAGMLPAAILLAFVGRRLGRVAWQREIVSLVSSGVLLAGPGSILLVGMAGLTLVFFFAVFVALAPGGLDALQLLLLNLQDPVWLEDPRNLASLVFSPVGLTGVFLLTVVIGPLIEEMLKPIGVLFFVWRRPRQAEVFLWGLAGASGFAMVEGMFNSAVNLDAWLLIALMRVGTSLMHCLAGGLVGLGWYFLWTARQPTKAIGLYLVAVVLHGTWNAAALGIGGLSFAASEIGEALTGLGIASLLGVLGLLAVVGLAALVLLVGKLGAALDSETDGGMAVVVVDG
jgi:hypothetical protein